MPVGNPCPFAPLLEDPFLGDWEAELGDGWISHVTFEDNQDYKEYEYELEGLEVDVFLNVS